MDNVIYPKKFPKISTLEQLIEHTRYIQEQSDFKIKQLIAENEALKVRVSTLEGS